MINKITSISLYNFRNYSYANIDINSENNKFIFLYGCNGSGKTSVLEAISLLGLGRGFRADKLSSIGNNDKDWRINLIINQDNIDNDYRIILNNNKKTISVNDQNHKKFILPKILWLIPQMIDVMSSTNKRDFFDRITYNYLPNHAEILINYNKLISQRLGLLKNINYDKEWLSIIEKDIVKYGLLIEKNRQEIIKILQNKIDSFDDYNIKIVLEDIVIRDDMEDVSQYYTNNLINYREKDILAKRTLFGVHRNKFTVMLNERNSILCSTGEQKSLLIAVIIAAIENQTILLLDDVLAHFDKNNI
ncbi:MAG: AAA family ATPase, partial [Anaplasmataceae bacterium]|nr:AAA family ATPase [Anaplasmataceae bacterium]